MQIYKATKLDCLEKQFVYENMYNYNAKITRPQMP